MTWARTWAWLLLSASTHLLGAQTGEGIAMPIASLRTLPLSARGLYAVRGVVTSTGSPFYIQDRSAGLEVRLPQPPGSLRLGDEILVTGRVIPGRYSSGMYAVSMRLLRASIPDPPLSVTPGMAASGEYDRIGIDTEGVLQSDVESAGKHVLLLRGDHQMFTAELAAGENLEAGRRLERGSFLRVRGICLMSDTHTELPVSFRVLLRSPEDITLLAGPPFWTRLHLALLALLLTLMAYATLVVIRRMEHWQFALVLEERTRMAYDLHDSLAQNFAGIAFQLQAIRSAVRKQKSEADIDQHVKLAIGMVSHSHEDARRSIAMLKPNELTEGDLLENLREQAEMLTHGGEIQVQLRSSGESCALQPALKLTLLRIGHEAITNAIRHAMPTVIAMHLAYAEKEIHFSIHDDGRGFQPHSASLRGFGLAGMHARAAAHGGTMLVKSSPGAGCTVDIRLPVSGKRQGRYRSALLKERYKSYAE